MLELDQQQRRPAVEDDVRGHEQPAAVRTGLAGPEVPREPLRGVDEVVLVAVGGAAAQVIPDEPGNWRSDGRVLDNRPRGPGEELAEPGLEVRDDRRFKDALAVAEAERRVVVATVGPRDLVDDEPAKLERPEVRRGGAYGGRHACVPVRLGVDGRR